jgi:hypothetical protein
VERRATSRVFIMKMKIDIDTGRAREVTNN